MIWRCVKALVLPAFVVALMVFTGSVFSSVWIVIANSWMHTPAGYRLVEENGRMRAEISDFWAMIAHHIVTISLVIMSWSFTFVRVPPARKQDGSPQGAGSHGGALAAGRSGRLATRRSRGPPRRSGWC